MVPFPPTTLPLFAHRSFVTTRLLYHARLGIRCHHRRYRGTPFRFYLLDVDRLPPFTVAVATTTTPRSLYCTFHCSGFISLRCSLLFRSCCTVVFCSPFVHDVPTTAHSTPVYCHACDSLPAWFYLPPFRHLWLPRPIRDIPTLFCSPYPRFPSPFILVSLFAVPYRVGTYRYITISFTTVDLRPDTVHTTTTVHYRIHYFRPFLIRCSPPRHRLLPDSRYVPTGVAIPAIYFYRSYLRSSMIFIVLALPTPHTTTFTRYHTPLHATSCITTCPRHFIPT